MTDGGQGILAWAFQKAEPKAAEGPQSQGIDVKDEKRRQEGGTARQALCLTPTVGAVPPT